MYIYTNTLRAHTHTHTHYSQVSLFTQHTVIQPVTYTVHYLWWYKEVLHVVVGSKVDAIEQCVSDDCCIQASQESTSTITIVPNYLPSHRPSTRHLMADTVETPLQRHTELRTPLQTGSLSHPRYIYVLVCTDFSVTELYYYS